uniref:Myb-like domain-containing protein n=1 Tax=Globisporangium ultimum (strain ATCC 200006 / CBS 805.95 / DAOM BR144) TaxID=431595 RepID=K3WC33_GLOUD
MPSPMQQPPQTPEFLPSISTSVVYSTVHAVWSPHEMQIFHRGFAEFPADKYDNVTRYIKIAAMLPGKCVRDVAFKAKALSVSQEKMSMNRDHFSKRMKIEPYQETPTLAFPIPMGGDDPEDAQLNALLQDNMVMMNTMRSNLLSGKLDDNKEPMLKFRDNCHTVLNTLGDICNSIPPLPVQLDTSLISSPRNSQ